MALIACKECRADISDKASVCPRCGAKLTRSMWWLLLVPAAALAVFLAYGASVPKYESDARAARRVCEQAYAAGAVVTLYECERQYDNMMANGRKP